jgi:hypothetical protein
MVQPGIRVPEGAQMHTRRDCPERQGCLPNIVRKNVLAPAPPAHHIIHGAGIFKTSLAWHEFELVFLATLINHKTNHAMG